MNAVDTNVLLYAHDPRDARKQKIAIDLISHLVDGVMLWQVANEYLAASRKLNQFGLSMPVANTALNNFRRVWAPALPTWAVVDRALSLMSRHSLSYWDGMIVAACAEAGVTRLYSEDITGYPSLDGVELINPF